jgi:3-phenylpropionate/cinnamic acid dioxygenase small subunit
MTAERSVADVPHNALRRARSTRLDLTGREAEHSRVTQFLAEDAMLLDSNRLWEWYERLADDFVYEIPIRVVREREKGGEFPAGAYRQRDTKASIRERIQRLDTGHAWAEDPATRAVRIVSDVALDEPDDSGLIFARSSLLVYREQVQDPSPELIVGQRLDRLRAVEEGLELVGRTVWLAHTTVNTANLGVFL